ncbi:MAG: efflux RND transporter periplasmic adaptor subunit [Syntrophomonadales bacterium]
MRRRKSSVLLVVILIMALFCSGGCGKEEVQKDVDNSLTVETVAVTQESIQKEVTYSGSLKGADEVTLYPKAAARVVAVHLQEGDPVAKGQTIISLDTTDYETQAAVAEATLAQAESAYENTRANVERTRLLHQEGAVSDQQMEQAEMGLIQASSALEQARAGVQSAQNLLSNCKVTSPINGVVGLIQITEGNMASPQAPVAVVSSTGRMAVKVNVTESEISFVSVNDSVKVRVSSVSDQEFTGKVTSVAAVADPRSKAFPVEVTLDDPDNVLKSGMIAQVQVSTEKKDGVLTIPRNAVVEKGARRVVYTVDDQSVVHETTIEVGLQNRERAEVIKGLKLGDQVVIKGQTLLHDKDEVRVAGGKV